MALLDFKPLIIPVDESTWLLLVIRLRKSVMLVVEKRKEDKEEKENKEKNKKKRRKKRE